MFGTNPTLFISREDDGSSSEMDTDILPSYPSELDLNVDRVDDDDDGRPSPSPSSFPYPSLPSSPLPSSPSPPPPPHTQFLPFARLPSELRRQIWEEAVRQPGVHFFSLYNTDLPRAEQSFQRGDDGGPPRLGIVGGSSRQFKLAAPFGGSWLVGNPSAYVATHSLSMACVESYEAVERARHGTRWPATRPIAIRRFMPPPLSSPSLSPPSSPGSSAAAEGSASAGSSLDQDRFDGELSTYSGAWRLFSAQDWHQLKSGDCHRLRLNIKHDLVCLQFREWKHVLKQRWLSQNNPWFGDGYGVSSLRVLERVALEYDLEWDCRFADYVHGGSERSVDEGDEDDDNDNDNDNGDGDQNANADNQNTNETGDAGRSRRRRRARVRLGIPPETLHKQLLGPKWMPAHFPEARGFYVMDYSIQPRLDAGGRPALARATSGAREAFHGVDRTYYEVRADDDDEWLVKSHVFSFVAWLRRANASMCKAEFRVLACRMTA